MADPIQFSEREKQVIALLIQGKSNKQIALALGVSLRTVEFHLSKIYAKLGVVSRTEAALRLSQTDLRASTGGGLRESAVLKTDESGDNVEKSIARRRIPVNKSSLIGLSILTLTAAFCVWSIYSMAKERAAAHDAEVGGPAVTQTDTLPVSAVAFITTVSSKEPMKVDQGADMALIRQIMGKPDLELTFQSIGEVPDAIGRHAAIYVDKTGAKYYVDIDSARLAAVDPNFPGHPNIASTDTKNMDELREVARQFATANSPRLAELESLLLYEENCKGSICFFRWDYRNKDWTGTDWIMMPPFLQVGVLLNGQIVTYNNTLDLVQ